MPRRIDLGRAILLGGAVLLFISLFLRWYDGAGGPNGWEVFETLDLVLAGLALAGAYVAWRAEAVAPAAIVGVPAAAVLIVFVQLVNDPPAVAGADPAIGAWLALVGSLLMLAGALFSLLHIAITVELSERELHRRVAAVDRRRKAGKPAADTATAPAPATPKPAAAEPDDLERTQPLASLGDDEEGAGRS